MTNNCRVYTFIVFVILFIAFTGILAAAIPSTERAALITFYNSTGGDTWTDNSGWKTPPLDTDGFAMPGTEGSWKGITVENGHVTSIDFLGNNLNGTLPAQLKNLVQLGNLSISNHSQLTGSIPRELGEITSLWQINMPHNGFTGTIPPELGNLTNLIYLSVATNQLTGTIPIQLANLTKLTSLRLDSNNLEGSIPAVLTNLANLEELNLVFNQLTGSIPPQLGNMSNLRMLYLNNNRLTGSIPPEIGNLTNLIALGMEFNQLTGPIPAALGNLTHLNDLRLRNNNLTVIPPQLGNLTNLELLYLSYNFLSGEVPFTFTQLTKLSVPSVELGYNCLYSNDATVRAWLDSVDPDWESTQNRCDSAEIAVNREKLNVGYVIGSSNAPTESFTVYNSGTGTLDWSVSTDMPQIILSPTSGVNWGTVEISLNTANLAVGTYSGIISVSDPKATNSPLEIDIKLNVKEKKNAAPPFGDFATPLDGSDVFSSIPVTGWALDDTGIESVKIYREEGTNLVYIGNAIMVEGARPDVESLYPDYPMNYKAGWGYMMLTNFLPDSGSGTFKIHAIVTDNEGSTTDLGVKTINVNNADAVKPFGAIDTPAQGGIASGSGFINWGWVLTPQPAGIPTDGSTIKVSVNGVNIGNPTYNLYREDIAALFPGYANSNGAVGYFYLDTSAYENGVHTIQWEAKDSKGNSDGIGSRYFTIQNTGSSRTSTLSSRGTVFKRHHSPFKGDVSAVPLNTRTPVRLLKGNNDRFPVQYLRPDEQGTVTVEIEELERIKLHFFSADRDEQRMWNVTPLPVGSTFYPHSGIFLWQPGPGFYGDYEFLFIKQEGPVRQRIRVNVKISPKR
jgi:hypothetical protein